MPEYKWVLSSQMPPTWEQVPLVPLPPLIYRPSLPTGYARRIDHDNTKALYKNYDKTFAKAWKIYEKKARENIPAVALNHDGGLYFRRLHEAFFKAANPPLPAAPLNITAPMQAAWHQAHQLTPAEMPNFLPTIDMPLCTTKKDLESYHYGT